jgi:hypothetical protein
MPLILNRTLLHIALLFAGSVSFGQGNELYDHGLDENKWNDLREGIRYENQPDGPGREWTYESSEEYKRAQRQYGGGGNGSGNGQGDGSGGTGQGNGGSNNGNSGRPDSDYSEPMPASSPSSMSGGIGVLGWILVVIFIALLAFLIYYMFVNRERTGKKVGAPVVLDEVNPTEIPLSELQRLLQEALARGDYRGAVRIYFIFILRDLSQKRWIHWEKEKTNFQYLREMSDKKEFDDFNRSVSYFEIIWYGKRDLDASKFELVKPNFTQLLDKLGVK